MKHEEVVDYCGGTIPFNFDELHYDQDDETGEALIECNGCDEASREGRWDWVDTVAGETSHREPEIHAVVLICPECGEENVFR